MIRKKKEQTDSESEGRGHRHAEHPEDHTPPHCDARPLVPECPRALEKTDWSDRGKYSSFRLHQPGTDR